ncbi:lipoprotein putative, integral membrane protein [Thermobacillus xylanilyticus]|uniref:Lipoprotein putative, integral membrane protein n=1 Tax=Thermobacillus xylanilyticus TaxID=76633 RepID=A0ABM8V039_THEXY|nr:aromatic acid exporter family protein [Thermobacillus xylanilyticus]CAG5076537.1 lipoprotein putative, integral membrane protein [Thermobacillus xylanilyticus]
MTIGARMLKTGLAVVLAIYVSGLFGFGTPIIATVAAIFTIQPSIYRSWQQVHDQIQSNIIGAAFALGAAQWLGVTPISVGIVCIAVILLNIRLKTTSAIGLTLVTVVAVMEAHAEGWRFALERFAMVLTGIISAFLVNVLVLPPRPKQQFREQVHEAYNILSLLLRTAVSNEIRERVFKEEHERLEQIFRRLDEQYTLFKEDRVFRPAGRRKRARQLLLSRQMIRTLRHGSQLLDAVEEHFYSSPDAAEWAERFDRRIEALTKCHEQLLLKWEGKIKPVAVIRPEPADDLAKDLSAYIGKQPVERRRLLFVASAMFEYAYHLDRLGKLLDRIMRDQSADEGAEEGADEAAEEAIGEKPGQRDARDR